MHKHILFIHGGGAGAHEADAKLAASLQTALGSEYDVQNPQMPNEDSPEYTTWKKEIAKALGAMKGTVILVGHSLGASMLLKYLSEAKIDSLAGVFLIAAPYWGTEDWQVEEYALSNGFAAELPTASTIYFYHSRDDEWVPFAHMALYAEQIPQAVFREFDGRGHQFNDDLSEVAADILSL